MGNEISLSVWVSDDGVNHLGADGWTSISMDMPGQNSHPEAYWPLLIIIDTHQDKPW